MSHKYRFQCQCVTRSSSPRELSQCPQPFQEHFMKAWEAITSKEVDLKGLKQLISEMKSVASDLGICAPLDVYRMLEEGGIGYVMTLMAIGGVCGQEKAVELILSEGAKIDAGCDKCGAPLFQMMFHCLVQNVKMHTAMVHYFTEKGSPLSRTICNLETDDQNAHPGFTWSLLDVPLTMAGMNGFECAKMLVETGKVDPITGGAKDGEKFSVVPMFQEYCYIGTNNYVRWLSCEHIPSHKRGVSEFVDRVFKCIIAMKRNRHFTTWVYKRRTPSHAILMSRNQETIALLVQKGKEQQVDFLEERNSVGRTALHEAAENGDLASVEILLQLEADMTACDNSGMTPFMLALENGHKEVAKVLLENNTQCLYLGRWIIDWALEKNLTLFFQVLGEVNPSGLLGPLTDHGGNTIVHQIAAAGNTEMFKIILELLWSNKLIQQVVQCQNREHKTALQLGVENDCIDILKAMKERLERRGPPITWELSLQNKWRSEVIPPLFLHASSCGSLTAVKYFINNGYEPNMRNKDNITPLQCAAKGGHDEIVKYLLQFRAVSSNPNDLNLALLEAAKNGNTRCVTLLLEKKASVLQTDTTGNNCLTLAIENSYKEAALAILSDEEQGLDVLRCVENKSTTPLRLLIKKMPELAEYVLNSVYLGKQVKGSVSGTEPFAMYHRQSLDDLLPEGASEDGQSPLIKVVEADAASQEGRATAAQHYKLKHRSDNHTLKWMINYKRLKLLQHPLVKEYLFYKFCRVALPVFLAHLLLYCIFLVLLTSFALVSPRPGPDSKICPEGNPNKTSNGTDCTGQSDVEGGFLAGAAGLLLFLCCAALFIEASKAYRRRFKYFTRIYNIYQVILFSLTITFVAPGFANNCWCAYNWQWQIGALVLCLGWFNLIIRLKEFPYTAIPINMFINICVTFLKVLFLPVLLLVAFALPFYMLFVHKATISEGIHVPALVSFASPVHALAKTLAQTVGEIGFEKIFGQGDLLYKPMATILFVVFLTIVPVLFINLLIGLAVGDTNKQKEKAEFTEIEAQVDFILEHEKNVLNTFWRTSTFFDERDELFELEEFSSRYHFTKFLARSLFLLENKEQSNTAMQERNKAIFSEVMGVSDMDKVKAALQLDSEKLLQLKEEIKVLTEKVETLRKDSNT